MDVKALDSDTVPLTGLSRMSGRVKVTPFMVMDCAAVPKNDTLLAAPDKVTPDPITKLP